MVQGEDPKSRLGELQLRIMRVLWSRGEATVAAVRDELASERELALSTVATVLSRLEDQDAVKHRKEGRKYVYRPLVTEREVRRSMVGELLDRHFGGDPGALLSHLLREEEVDPDELERLRERLEEAGAEDRSDDPEQDRPGGPE